MKHHSILVLFALCVSARAEEREPERLLSSTTQVYAHWDGIAAHQKAYDESARGRMFAGETGQAFARLEETFRRLAKMEQAGNPLLNGQPPEEVRQALADVKAVFGLPKLLAQTGLVVGFEIRPPSYDFATLAKLIRGNADERARVLQPQFLLTVIVPTGADRPEIAAGVRLFVKEARAAVKERTIDGRKVMHLEQGRDEPTLAVWAEDKHFVLTVGNLPIEQSVAKIKNAGAGVTSHPLYKRVQGFKEFHVVTRGFIDVGNIVSSFEKVIKAYEPALWPIIDATGATGLKSACFWDGFDGIESRGVIEFDIPGPRRGLTRFIKPSALKPADLPPLPADLTRFTAARLDLNEIYETLALIAVVEGGYFDSKDDDAKKLTPEENFRMHKEKILRDADGEFGIKLAEFFGAFGDTVVTYQAPSDGLLNLGQVVAFAVKDEKSLRRSLEALERKLEAATRSEIAMKKRDCLGVEVHEFIVKDKSPVTVSYAICDGWLVFALQPQPVRGFIYRSKGKLPVWKPDARTAATLAKIPADRCVLQVADPRVSLQWLYGAAPALAGMFSGRNDNNPFLDPGLFPHAGEATQHLFPNVMWCRDDGRTMRWESRDSLWLPLEFLGPEIFGVYFGALGGIFR